MFVIIWACVNLSLCYSSLTHSIAIIFISFLCHTNTHTHIRSCAKSITIKYRWCIHWCVVGCHICCCAPATDDNTFSQAISFLRTLYISFYITHKQTQQNVILYFIFHFFPPHNFLISFTPSIHSFVHLSHLVSLRNISVAKEEDVLMWIKNYSFQSISSNVYGTWDLIKVIIEIIIKTITKP
jgi:hypothetical protein